PRSAESTTPDMSLLTREEQAQVDAVCSETYTRMGHDAYTKCLASEQSLVRNQSKATAKVAVMTQEQRPPIVETKPADSTNLSTLSAPERSSAELACFKAKMQGPAAYNECLIREAAGLNSAPRYPDLPQLSSEETASAEMSC